MQRGFCIEKRGVLITLSIFQVTAATQFYLKYGSGPCSALYILRYEICIWSQAATKYLINFQQFIQHLFIQVKQMSNFVRMI